MKTSSQAFLLVNVICVASCASVQPARPSNDVASAETRVFYGGCIGIDVPETESEIGVSLGSAIIGNTLERVGSALRRAGEEDAFTESSFRSLDLTMGTVAPCIQIIKGAFDNDPKGDEDAKYFPFLLTATEAAKVPDRLNRTNIRVSREPDFFFEAKLESSKNKSALKLVPTAYSYRKPLDPTHRDNQPYGLVLSISFHAPGINADAKEAYGVSIPLGSLRPGTNTSWQAESVQPVSIPRESIWFPSFSVVPRAASPTPTKTNAQAQPTPAQPAQAPAPAPAPVLAPEPAPPAASSAPVSIPMILSASVVETRKPREVLLFLADVFDDTKKDIQTSVEQALISSKGDAAGLAEYTQKQTDRADYYTKFAAAEAAYAAYCAVSLEQNSTESSRLTESAKLFAAQGQANIAAQKANLPMPYPDLVQITGERLNCN